MKRVLAGKVADPNVVVRRATLDIGDTQVTRDTQTSFTLEVDGREIHVEVDEETQIFGRERAKGAWSDLESREIAKVFDVEPAPDAKVTIEWVEIKGGDSVAVYGHVTTMRQGGSYREGAEEVVRSINAVVVAYGDDGQQMLDERVAKDTPQPPRPARPWGLWFALGLMALGVAVAAVAFLAIEDLPYQLDLAVFGGGHILIGAVVAWGVRPKYVFFGKERAWSTAIAFGLYLGGLVFFLPPLFDLPERVEYGKRIYVGPLGFAGWAVTFAILAVFVLRLEWRTLETTRRLLTAPRHSSPPKDGEWGVSEGIVEGAALAVDRQPAALVSLFEEEYMPGSSPNKEVHSTKDAPFVLARSDGARVQIDPRGGYAGSAYFVLGKKGSATANNKKVMLSTYFVPEGSAALVLGRMELEDDTPKLSAGLGADSLVVFSAPSPIRRVLLVRWLSSVMLLGVLILGAIALAILTAYHPFLPEMHSVD